MASIGVRVFTLLVQPQEKPIIITTTVRAHRALIPKPPAAPSTMVSDTLCSIMLPKGMLRQKPTAAPTAASIKYFKM
jgi:hypothetical protein